jgi:hypothetical protein
VSAPDANRDCGVRLGVSRTCGVLFASPWGTLDGATIGCINAGAAALRGTGGPPVALLEFPLGRPVFIAPRDGVGELKWLRRGLPKPAAAMKGAPRVAIGPATPVETGDFSVTFLDGRYRLRMSGGPLVEPYVPGVLSLQRGGRTQVLLTGVQSFRVPWAGDVDGDGRLDLLIEWTETSFARSIDLFLSRDAGEGRLVRLAATDPGVE